VIGVNSDISSADAEMKDTPHCGTQREQTKGTAEIFQTSTISQMNLNIILSK